MRAHIDVTTGRCVCASVEEREGNSCFVVWGIESQVTHRYIGCYGPSIAMFCINVWPKDKVQESQVEVLWRLFYYVKFYSPKCSDLVAMLTLIGE